jgi:hypothetical protein
VADDQFVSFFQLFYRFVEIEPGDVGDVHSIFDRGFAVASLIGYMIGVSIEGTMSILGIFSSASIRMGDPFY